MPIERNLSSELMYAAVMSDNSAIQELILEKADVNTQDPIGTTPLILCVIKKNNVGLQILIDARAKVDHQRRSDNSTALMLAASEGYTAGVQRLITSGADVSLTNNQNKTAINIFCDNLLNNTALSYFSSHLIKLNFLKIEKPHDKVLDKVLDKGKMIQEACQNNTISFVQQERDQTTYRPIVGNTTSLLPATTVATIAISTLSGIISIWNDTAENTNLTTINQVTSDIVSFSADHSENMDWLPMAAVGVAAVGLVGGLVWGTRTCLNLNKTVKNYDLNPHSTELSLIEHS